MEHRQIWPNICDEKNNEGPTHVEGPEIFTPCLAKDHGDFTAVPFLRLCLVRLGDPGHADNLDTGQGLGRRAALTGLCNRSIISMISVLHINTGWGFGTFFIFPYIGNHHPN